MDTKDEEHASMSVVRVIKPGLLTTVQDRGRWGFQARGVSVAGPMDAYAASAGQRAGRQRSMMPRRSK